MQRLLRRCTASVTRWWPVGHEWHAAESPAAEAPLVTHDHVWHKRDVYDQGRDCGVYVCDLCGLTYPPTDVTPR